MLKHSFSIRFDWRTVHCRCFWLQFFQRGSHVEIWSLFLQVLHFGQFAAFFCCSVQLGPSMMKSSSSSRAPCKLVSATDASMMSCDQTQPSNRVPNNNINNRRLSQACPLFCLRHLFRWTSASSPGPELLTVANSDDCAHGGDMSSS